MAYLDLIYGSAAFPLNVDLIADGANCFKINVAFLTPGLWRGSYFFRVKAADHYYLYHDLDQDFYNLDAPGEIVIPFSYLAGADLAQVQEITISISRFEPGFTMVLDSFATAAIPEPASYAWGAGAASVACLALRRRRRTP